MHFNFEKERKFAKFRPLMNGRDSKGTFRPAISWSGPMILAPERLPRGKSLFEGYLGEDSYSELD